MDIPAKMKILCKMTLMKILVELKIIFQMALTKILMTQ